MKPPAGEHGWRREGKRREGSEQWALGLKFRGKERIQQERLREQTLNSVPAPGGKKYMCVHICVCLHVCACAGHRCTHVHTHRMSSDSASSVMGAYPSFSLILSGRFSLFSTSPPLGLPFLIPKENTSMSRTIFRSLQGHRQRVCCESWGTELN